MILSLPVFEEFTFSGSWVSVGVAVSVALDGLALEVGLLSTSMAACTLDCRMTTTVAISRKYAVFGVVIRV